MAEPKNIAIAALKILFEQKGKDFLFTPGDVFALAQEEVDGNRRGPLMTWLAEEGYVEKTGRSANAVGDLRKRSPTTEYRFGPRFQVESEAVLAEIGTSFAESCKSILEIPVTHCSRICSSLLAKRFLIFTGLAGSGKTKLAQALARWITPEQKPESDSNPNYILIPVGADWTGNENILGYPNGLIADHYVTKPALDLILHAVDAPETPHFLILDEMNLSHVERYFADILSALESDEAFHLYLDLERKVNGRTIPKTLVLPQNLFIIGTVNVDETTYMFSPKVLDRANVIEFRMDTHEIEEFLNNPTKPDLSSLDGKGAQFGKAFVDAAKNPVSVPSVVKQAYESEMLLFFKVLKGHGAEFGYRVAHEAARFIHFYSLLGNYPAGDATWFPGAFDCVVVQKFLPKLHGSRTKLGPLLKKLWFLSVSDEAGRGTNPLQAAEEAARSTDKKAEPAAVVPEGARYSLSAEKIGRMWRLLNENGFTSFAEA